MEFLFILVIVAVGIYILRKASNAQLEDSLKKSIKISVISDSPKLEREENFIPDEVTLNDTDEFIINSYSELPLSIIGCDFETAKAIKVMLENMTDWNREAELTFLIMQHDIRCKEIDLAVDRLRIELHESLQKRITSSSEWNELSDKDCNDALEEYTIDIINGLDDRPYDVDSLRILIENTKHDYSADNQLIQLFAGNAKLYKFYINKVGRSIVPIKVPADDQNRKMFESLVDMNLAIRGKGILSCDILNMLKLADLNQLFDNRIEKPFGRKAKAIEFALQLPDIDEFISTNIALREIFQLKTPDSIDMTEILKCFQFASAYSKIFIDTFDTGLRSYSQKHYSNNQGYEYWHIEPGECCLSCKSRQGKRTKRIPTKLPPFHVGCVCSVSGEY